MSEGTLWIILFAVATGIANVVVPVVLCHRAARAKRRSGAWAYAGFLHVFGIIWVAVLEPGRQLPGNAPAQADAEGVAEALEDLSESTGHGASPAVVNEEMKSLAEVAAEREAACRPVRIPLPKPLLVKAIPWCAAFGSLIGLAMMLLLVLPLDGDYSIYGRPVSREEFVAAALPVVSLVFAFYVCLAYGFWREKLWSRHVLVFLGVVSGATVPWIARGPGAVCLGLLQAALWVAVFAWYFYGKENVVALSLIHI